MKRLLALLLVSLCLLTVIACDTTGTPKETLPEKTAAELIRLTRDKMNTYTAFEMSNRTTVNEKSGSETSKEETASVLRRAGSDAYLSADVSYVSAGSSLKSKTVITIIGEDAYMDVEMLGEHQKVKMSKEDISILASVPTMEEIISSVAANDYSTATVKAETDTWTVTLHTVIDLSGAEDPDAGETPDPGEEDPDLPVIAGPTVKNAKTVLVIDRNYNLKSITVTYDYEQEGRTGTSKMTATFSKLGTAKVAIPDDADTYMSAEGE